MPPSETRSFETRSFHTPNLLPDDHQPERSPEPPKNRRIRIYSCFFIVVIVLATSCTALLGRSNNNFFVGVKNGFIMRQITHLFSGNTYQLKGERDDRINFLLMGIGGPGHEGPYLTDTIILASFKPSTNEASMISIPRDLIVPVQNGTYLKVNSIYALNQKNGLERAFAVTKEAIGTAFGLPIHYMGVVDFHGFEKLMDSIGGITITVDTSFTDYQFPNNTKGVQVVSFKKGEQKMDGATALTFARSRHGTNGESSDFARSKRQQKIMLATKEKLASFNTLFNPWKITSLFSLVNEYTKTDIEPWEVVKLVQMAKDIDKENIYDVVLDDLPGGYLYSGISSIDGAYILQPRGGNFFQLQNLAQNIFKDSALKHENPTVVIQNGTAIENAASTIADGLTRTGVKPLALGNADKKTYVKTEIYDYTDGGKPLTKKILESWFDTEAKPNIPLEYLGYNIARKLDLRDENNDFRKLDFLIILGQDMQGTERREIIRTLTPQELAASSTQPFSTTSQELIKTQ